MITVIEMLKRLAPHVDGGVCWDSPEALARLNECRRLIYNLRTQNWMGTVGWVNATLPFCSSVLEDIVPLPQDIETIIDVVGLGKRTIVHGRDQNVFLDYKSAHSLCSCSDAKRIDIFRVYPKNPLLCVKMEKDFRFSITPSEPVNATVTIGYTANSVKGSESIVLSGVAPVIFSRSVTSITSATLSQADGSFINCDLVINKVTKSGKICEKIGVWESGYDAPEFSAYGYNGSIDCNSVSAVIYYKKRFRRFQLTDVMDIDSPEAIVLASIAINEIKSPEDYAKAVGACAEALTVCDFKFVIAQPSEDVTSARMNYPSFGL